MPGRSLRALIAAFLALFVVVTLSTGVGIYSASQATIENLVDFRIHRESEALLLGVRGDVAAIGQRIETFGGDRDTGDLGFVLFDARGKQLEGNVQLRRRLPLGYSSLTVDDRIKGLSYGRALVSPAGDGLFLATIAETEPFDHYHIARLRIYLVGFGSILLVVGVATLVFGMIIRRRIVEMRRTVEAIIDGDLQHRVPVDGSNSAFDQQAQAFNRMLDRIEALMREIASVSSDIAHDLRTPLARMRHRLERLAALPQASGVREEVEEALGDADQLLAMFAAILRISEVEGGERRAAFGPVDLAALVCDIADTMAAVGEESGHVVQPNAAAPTMIEGDRQLLRQALVNLVENALRHTPAGSRIDIAVTCVPDAVLLSVSDNGPGIPAEAQGQAFRRFGRLDSSRSRPGHGLGLPLAEAIARLHRGALVLEDARPGLRVTMRLPR